jgi:hypothetical protein
MVFFDNVLMLEIATDVTKAKVTPIISQMRNPNFNNFGSLGHFGSIYYIIKIPLALINSLLDAEVLMTSEERDDLISQRSLINRVVNHLPPLEPDRIKFKSEVA